MKRTIENIYTQENDYGCKSHLIKTNNYKQMKTKIINIFSLKLVVIASISILFLFNSFTLAQNDDRENKWSRKHGKIEQLEKIKIIELLDLDEQTTLTFFSRRDEHHDQQRSLMDKRDLLYDELYKTFNSKDEVDYHSKISEIFAVETEMLKHRENFFSSLSDILTEKQIAELIVFEVNFRTEMRHQFIKQTEKRKFRN